MGGDNRNQGAGQQPYGPPANFGPARQANWMQRFGGGGIMPGAPVNNAPPMNIAPPTGGMQTMGGPTGDPRFIGPGGGQFGNPPGGGTGGLPPGGNFGGGVSTTNPNQSPVGIMPNGVWQGMQKPGLPFSELGWGNPQMWPFMMNMRNNGNS